MLAELDRAAVEDLRSGLHDVMLVNNDKCRVTRVAELVREALCRRSRESRNYDHCKSSVYCNDS